MGIHIAWYPFSLYTCLTKEHKTGAEDQLK